LIIMTNVNFVIEIKTKPIKVNDTLRILYPRSRGFFPFYL